MPYIYSAYNAQRGECGYSTSTNYVVILARVSSRMRERRLTYRGLCLQYFINPRRACAARVTVVVLCVCVCVCVCGY